jgi:antibiotic biosynthesis monooxygenase (ABM) superfamily enzyme
MIEQTRSFIVDIRISRATAVVVQRIPDAGVAWFLDWQRGITGAMEAFRGHRGTDVYPPPGGRGGEWVVVISFEDAAALQVWLDSPVREQWVGKLRARIGNFDLKVLPGGFASWFVGCLHGSAGSPPSWKMALVVLLGLYPTVMALTIVIGPYVAPLGPAWGMLIGNALSVSILQWAVMPVLNLLAASWLGANGGSQRRLSIGGGFLILGILAGTALLLRQVTG